MVVGGTGVVLYDAREHTLLHGVPNKDYTKITNKEPTYMQHCLGTRKLMSETPCLEYHEVDDIDWRKHRLSEDMVIIAGAQLFLTGHSERATLTTWASATGLEKSERDYLGRWLASASDEYDRQSFAVVQRLQSKIASNIRNAEGKDVCGEDHMLRELVDFCVERDANMIKAAGMKAALINNRNFAMDDTAAFVLEPDLVANPADLPIYFDREGFADPELSNEGTLSAGVFVVSQTKGGTQWTLHKIGSCWRTPGRDYRRFAVLDGDENVMTNEDALTGAKLYNKVCKDSFPSGLEDDSDADTDSKCCVELLGVAC